MVKAQSLIVETEYMKQALARATGERGNKVPVGTVLAAENGVLLAVEWVQHVRS